jgi:hypothetical protein
MTHEGWGSPSRTSALAPAVFLWSSKGTPDTETASAKLSFAGWAIADCGGHTTIKARHSAVRRNIPTVTRIVRLLTGFESNDGIVS